MHLKGNFVKVIITVFTIMFINVAVPSNFLMAEVIPQGENNWSQGSNLSAQEQVYEQEFGIDQVIQEQSEGTDNQDIQVGSMQDVHEVKLDKNEKEKLNKQLNERQNEEPKENNQHQDKETVGPGKSGTTLSTSVCAEASLIQFVKYNWEITKSVDESFAVLALGDATDFHYSVKATRIPVEKDLQAEVTGVVEVTNGGDRPTENLMVKVQLLYKAGKGEYRPLTELQVIATDLLMSGQTKAYTYFIPFTPVKNASYKIQTYTTITNHSGHIGTAFGPPTAAELQVPSQATQRTEDEIAVINDEMIIPEGFSISSTGAFPWIVNETDLAAGEDGFERAEKNYIISIRNNSAQTNALFALNNTAILKESDSNEKHEASQTVTINTKNIEINGAVLNSEVSAIVFWNKELVYDWSIMKIADPISLSLAPGSSGTVNYILKVNRTLTEESVETSGVAGTVTVKNVGNEIIQNLQINLQVKAKSGTEYQDIPEATQLIVPSQQLIVGQQENYNYKIKFTPVLGAEYKVVACIIVTDYAGQQGIPYETSLEQRFTLPIHPEETSSDNIAMVNDVISPLQGFTIIGGLAGSWAITEADLAVDESKLPVTKNYSVTVINNSAEVNANFKLNNMATLTENDSKVVREAQAQVQIVTPDERVIDHEEPTDPGEPTDHEEPIGNSEPGESEDPADPGEIGHNDSTNTDKAVIDPSKQAGEREDSVIDLSDDKLDGNSANEFELPNEAITPPQDEAPMIPTNMFYLPIPNETLVNNENTVSNEVTNSLTKEELMLPYTGGNTGLFVTLGIILVLYGNGLRRNKNR